MADNKFGYQKFRGNPEVKLFYLINNFIGGINTEFTDDKSSVADLETIINFDADRLGTLHKRQGFGELTALSDIFNKLPNNLIPVVKNRTEDNLNPEEDNDNIVYMNLLQNDNNCFRNLAGFSGNRGYRNYQKMYGFQNNTFRLLLITTAIVDKTPISSTAWYYKCTLPEYILQLEPTSDITYMKNGEYNTIRQTTDVVYEENKEYFKLENGLYTILVKDKDYGIGETIINTVYERTELIEGTDYNVGDEIQNTIYTPVDNIVIEGYKVELPVIFNWDRNLLNMESIEYYDKIYFTNNDKGLVCFDREATITSNGTLASAFSYAGFSETGITNIAFKPSAYEVALYGFNMLASDPIHYIEDSSLSSDSIQGVALFDKDFKPTYDVIPVGQKFMVGIYYTGSHSDFTLTFSDVTDMSDKKVYPAGSVTVTANASKSTTGFKVYDIQFLSNPTDKIELKVEMQNSSISPQYDYYTVGSVDASAPVITGGINAGDCGIAFMNNRALLYNKDTIWFSQINDFTYVPSNNYITFPLVSTDRITKICYFKKSYIVFTKYQIWKITGGYSMTLSDLTKELVNESIGCHAGHTVVPIDNTLYFASPRGLYSLKSNQFVEGYENVGELDVKVKTLTSDYTLYAENRENPAIRYNGINEHAYAFRYKDKYILFYNNYGDKGDYAAANGLDALVYQFSIGAYTTYRFKEKPTFLFMVDNAIESLSTVKVKEEFTEDNVLFNYNFLTADDSTKVVNDLSGNGNNASLVGNAVINRSTGISLNGTNAYGQIADFSGEISKGFEINLETKCASLNGASLIHLSQDTSSINAQPTSGSFSTNNVRGYWASVEYTITPNVSTKKDTVSYKIYYRGDGTVPANTGSLKYSIRGTEGTLVSERTKSFNISSGSALIDSGTFTITRNSSGAYSSSWSINISSSYITTSTTISKGPNVNLDGEYWATTGHSGSHSTTFNWLQMGFKSFVATATDVGCKITFTPAVRLTSGLYVGKREIRTYIGDYVNKQNLTINGNGSSSPVVFAGSSETYYFEYSGNKTITIRQEFNANFKRNSDGRYYSLVETSSHSHAMPSVTTTTVSTTNNYSLSGSKQIAFSSYGTSSYRYIDLSINGNADQLAFTIDSEYGTARVLTGTGLGLLDKHSWRIVVTSGGSCTIYRDGVNMKYATLDPKVLVNATRTINYIGTNRTKSKYYSGEIYSLNVIVNTRTIMSYDFIEGKGSYAYDRSGYGRKMTLYNTSWLVVQGLALKDTASFISLPKLTGDVPFTNGFKIEFEGVINAYNLPVKVIDLAKAYQSETSAVKFNSINVTFQNNMMTFNSTGLNNRTYTVTADNIDTTISHSYKIDCVDNGKGYDISIYVDNTLKATNFFNYGGIANIKRASNLIGKSNDSTEINAFRGNLLNMKFTIYGSATGIPVYRSAIYEFDTTAKDFDKPIYIEAKTKGVNLQYPQHMKKLKHTFVKAIGGDELSQLFFEIYVDGYLVNDPHKYVAHFDEDGTIVLDYTAEENLNIEGVLGRLGGLLVDKTRPGEGNYQTIKMVIPEKGKNFTIRMYGESQEFLTVESFGMVCKLGKVKQG